MGKKSKSKTKQSKKNNSSGLLPNVSICTPTFNRRPFFEGLIQCIAAQDYPRQKMEWVVVDDGTDCVKDIIESEKCKETLKGIKIVYVYEKEKMDLGKKRNLMHQKCTFKDQNDIIVYMDDDDYYPPKRVSHSVSKLLSNPKVLCGGSSEIYLWFNSLNSMYKFGPYGPNHATAGTFAFKRSLLLQTHYEDEAVLAEEKHFLKDYTVPFIQFDPMHTILVVSHEQNTFDKKRLVNKENKFCKESALKVHHFIKDASLCEFYHSKINTILKEYSLGDVKHKPKVLQEIARRDKERKQAVENRPSGIIIGDANNNNKELTIAEVKHHMESQMNQNHFLKNKVNELTKQNNDLQQKNNKLQTQITEICLKFMNDSDGSNNNTSMQSYISSIKQENNVDEKDIDVVVSQTSCTREKAIEMLTKNDNDIVNAIMDIMK